MRTKKVDYVTGGKHTLMRKERGGGVRNTSSFRGRDQQQERSRNDLEH